MPVMKQLSIKEQGGIEIKLEDERRQHNGFGYKEFDLFCKLRLPNTVIAKLMNIKTVDTVKKWKGARIEHKKLTES